jgi:hypothetical protein
MYNFFRNFYKFYYTRGTMCTGWVPFFVKPSSTIFWMMVLSLSRRWLIAEFRPIQNDRARV